MVELLACDFFRLLYMTNCNFVGHSWVKIWYKNLNAQYMGVLWSSGDMPQSPGIYWLTELFIPFGNWYSLSF